jgi:adenylylsulfate kinase
MLGRESKEAQLGQTGHVFWFYGLSGSGKSTLANALERKLVELGYVTKILDGDNIRSGLNSDLGFSDEDRVENIRRISEVARLFLDMGVVVFTSFITPKRDLRASARAVVGDAGITPVYVAASFETCAERDVKGLYAKAAAGGVKHFTGKDSAFEAPEADDPDWTVVTDNRTEEESLNELLEKILPLIQKSTNA